MADQVHGCAVVAEGRALAALPVDVLRLILKDIRLKERLRLEILNKSHREALRDPELWDGIDLGAEDALDCTEDQLLSLLVRIEPRLQKAAKRIRRMAQSLDDVSKSFTVPDLAVEQLKRKTRATWCRQTIYFVLCWLPFLHRAVPKSWGPARFALKTCTLWLSDQLERIPLGVRSVCILLRNMSENGMAFPRSETRGLLMEKLEQQRPRKQRVFLNVSGAVNLSPNFLATCAIAFSAAGVRVNIRMNGEGDPGFMTNSPAFDMTRILALNCSFNVNLLISGAHSWNEYCLTPFAPTNQAHEWVGATEAVETKLKRVTALVGSYSWSSRAEYQKLLGKLASLVQLRAEIAAVTGCETSQRGATARVLSNTAILENLVSPMEQELLDELWSFPDDVPSAFRVVVRNCTLTDAEFGSLSAVLGKAGFGTVTFQHHGHVTSRNPSMAQAILGSAKLQGSEGLHALALDFPLAPADLDSVALFLERNTAGARVVIHLRPAFYAQSAAASPQLFPNLMKLCVTHRRNGRLTIVRHQGGARSSSGTDVSRAADWGGTVANTRGGLLEVALLTPLKEEIQSQVQFEDSLRAADGVIWCICIVDVILGLALLLDYFLSRVRLFWFISGLGVRVMIQVFFAAFTGWPPLRAAIQGERDPLDIVTIVISVGLVPFLPMLGATVRALCLYLCACLTWTGLKPIGKIAAGRLRGVGSRIKARVLRWSVRLEMMTSAKKQD